MSTKSELVDALRAAKQRISDLEAELRPANDRREELEGELYFAKDQIESLTKGFEDDIDRVLRSSKPSLFDLDQALADHAGAQIGQNVRFAEGRGDIRLAKRRAVLRYAPSFVLDAPAPASLQTSASIAYSASTLAHLVETELRALFVELLRAASRSGSVTSKAENPPRQTGGEWIDVIPVAES